MAEAELIGIIVNRNGYCEIRNMIYERLLKEENIKETEENQIGWNIWKNFLKKPLEITIYHILAVFIFEALGLGSYALVVHEILPQNPFIVLSVIGIASGIILLIQVAYVVKAKERPCLLNLF